MSIEPKMIALKESEFRSWLDSLSEASNPQITYTEDSFEMLKNAYVKRGDCINFIMHRLLEILPPEK